MGGGGDTQFLIWGYITIEFQKNQYILRINEIELD